MSTPPGPEYAAAAIDPAWLAATYYLDHDDDRVGRFTEAAIGDATTPTDRAVRLFHAVRDGIRYDPYGISYEAEAFRASSITERPANWCVPKSILFAAGARSIGIPARLGFADVRNHLTSEKLSAQMGTDVFAWHGYAELLLPDPTEAGSLRWFKLSTAFNVELCERFGVKVLEFDGTADALMHPYDESGRRHMEYIRDRGSFDDFPRDQMLVDFAELYGNSFGEVGDAGSAEAAGDEAFSA